MVSFDKCIHRHAKPHSKTWENAAEERYECARLSTVTVARSNQIAPPTTLLFGLDGIIVDIAFSMVQKNVPFALGVDSSSWVNEKQVQ